ncbi:MAG TPA: hypothetical protein VGZ32_22325 [Actinocrinis sp.]|jgi:hypothetical protein|uniref:ImmA/IrrE family metallo-endopeptidase n=1 Tax=Actinocrinis sp. TaxID=1920516 RepID=UPI002DDCCB5B|nr:hypothetical protein [Actinocrinis sp.]HEV3173100.1 hypothetical protein [Actinocrinis sp.]
MESGLTDGARAAAQVGAGLSFARQVLRDKQALWGALAGAVPVADGRGAALARAEERVAGMKRIDPDIIDGKWRYDSARERERQSLTREIIERVNPGPYEDPRFMAMLARQAASVELAVRGGIGTQATAEVLERIIVGTTGEPRSEAYSEPVAAGVVVAVSGGMMEFLYQGAKAVALAWPPTNPAAGYAQGVSVLPERIEAALATDPYPIELLRDTLTAWLYEGRPRAIHSRLPPVEVHAPITLLINGAERFILAHEYGHALIHHLHVLAPDAAVPGDCSEAWRREFAADAFAVQAVVASSRTLDRLPANMGLLGAMLAMKACEIFDEAFVISATTGDQPKAPAVSLSHPPFTQRRALLETLYVARHDRNPTAARLDLPGMRAGSDTLDLLWARAAPEVAAAKAGRVPHPIWSAPAS